MVLGRIMRSSGTTNANVGASWTPDQGNISTAHSENPGTWNRYAYVAGDPMNFKDPHGRDLMYMDLARAGDQPLAP